MLAGVALAEPWPLAFVVDTVVGDKPPPEWLTGMFGESTGTLILVAVVGSLLITLLAGGLTVINEYLTTTVDQRMVLDLRSDLFQHAQRLPLSFHDDARTGILMYRINNQATSVGRIVVSLPVVAQSVLTVLGMAWIAWRIDPVLAGLALAVTPFIYYSTTYYADRIEPELLRVRGLEGMNLSIVHEAMAMLRVVIAFGREGYEYGRFRRQGEQTVDARVRLTVRQTLFKLGVNFITAAGTAAVLGVGAYRVINGHISVGELLVVMAYIAAVYAPLVALTTTITAFQQHFIALEHALELLDTPLEVTEKADAIPLGRGRGAITFEKVNFGYRTRPDTLKDVSFHLEPGQALAVVGPTGAGKSTLVSLIPRFYDVAQGRVLIDGVDVRDATIDSLRDQFSIVLQEPLLFSGSIADNIRYGKTDATDEEVHEAAKAANAHDFITKLPERYGTRLGERGSKISGGERQRISVARAFLRDAPILILDEPTSSIDSKTEGVILEALDRLMEGRTTIMIAHRLSTIRRADKILVLNDGALVESGSHGELLANDGLYCQLWEAQVGASAAGRPEGASPSAAAPTNGDRGSGHEAPPPGSQPVDPAQPSSPPAAAPPARPAPPPAPVQVEPQPTGAPARGGRSTPSLSREETTAGVRRGIERVLDAGRASLQRRRRALGPAGGTDSVLSPAAVGGGPSHGRPKVVLLGLLSKMPVGGVAWLVLQYAIGFKRLGFDVYYVEAHAKLPSMLLRHERDDGSDAAAELIDRVMRLVDMGDRWAFHALHHDGRCLGMSEAELRRVYREAALIVNLHGGTTPRPEHAETGRLVYLGTDPVDVELELHRNQQAAIDFLEPHIAFFTWGLNYGNPDCTLPWSDRFPMVPSPPPVVTELWDNDHIPSRAPFTTIGNWRQEYRDIEFRGETYRWSKHHEFLRVLELPSMVDSGLELALSSYTDADRVLLEAYGWGVRPGLELSGDVESYRNYIVGSQGEFSVAKDQNVRLRTGWFSERSATYLAAGRPVILQDTGFGNALPTGDGLFAFGDIDEAAAAIGAVEADPERHRRAARELAREHLDHDVVLTALLDHVGIDAPRSSARRQPPASIARLPLDVKLTPIRRRPLELQPEVGELMAEVPIPMLPGRADPEPDASILVITINNPVVTRLTLDSVLANTHGASYEIIVVDNGSAPPTRRYLSVLAARNDNVRLICNEENRGFAAATNQALEAARGRHVVLLNNDVMVPPGWLEGLLGHLERDSVGMVGPVTNRCGNEAEVTAPYDTYGGMVAFSWERRSSFQGRSFEIPVAVMFCAALRRSVVDQVGPLDERFELGLFEDDDYARRVRDAGYEVVCAEDVFVHHFGEASLGWLAAAGRYGELFEANRRRFEEKWGTVWSPHSRRTGPEYLALQQGVRDAALQHVPPGAVVLVISRGDDVLLEMPGLEGWHFPRRDDGTYAGSYPADDHEAIAQLERLRELGASHLLVPAPSRWWLDHYRGLAEHLRSRGHELVDLPDVGVIYALDGQSARELPSSIGGEVSS